MTGLKMVAEAVGRETPVDTATTDRGVRRSFLAAETHPANLGVFRIVVFSALGATLVQSSAAWYATLPPDLRFVPWGAEWLALLPLKSSYVMTAKWLGIAASAFACIGLFSRSSAATATVAALIVLGVPQMYGKVNHYHFLVWFAGLLALSPCGDALSVDALRRSTVQPAPSRAHALPIRVAWLLMGVLYFFPGLWKLLVSGIDWAWSDNPKYQMYLKWWTDLPEDATVWRLDRHAMLYRLGASATVLFEILFIFMVPFRRLRLLLVVAGLAFHNLTYLTMRISFWPLQLMYLTFFDWARIGRLKSHRGVQRRVLPVFGVVAAVLFLGNLVFGAAHIHSWPFSVFPTFAEKAGPTVAVITIEVVGESGSSRTIQPLRTDVWPTTGDGRLSGLLLSILGPNNNSATRREQLEALWSVFSRSDADLQRAKVVRFYRDRYWTNPSRRHYAPIERTLLYELDLRVVDQPRENRGLSGPTRASLPQTAAYLDGQELSQE